ncbi:SMI1/KNR4 family protein [Roseateles sp. DAIF2]|uniref:SMI1/KNR4 family protein n=1 Tax=Roseateles sp. DAIF2 TaxID=2714952 RepID=UPI0018A2B44E|nr:SMI1/KNR4 family protein [Roseateles sp. DAIF2]QPF74690.1 SMI1/KNR4 family protein [Roseateles sp. DAIF2]
MATFNLYPSDSLPQGFVYPHQLREIAATGQHPQIAPWWFVDADSKAGKLFFSIRKHDGRNLVPFAKVDDGRGDIACFDGDDSSGNPRVLMLVLDESERAYSFADFSQWLESAQMDASR